MAPKTIVYFSTRYFPNLGGLEFFTGNLVTELAREGHRVYVVTGEPGAEGVKTPEGVTIIPFDTWGWRRVPFVAWDRRTRGALRQVVTLHPDGAVINTRFYGFCRVAARLCNRRLGLTPVLIDHGTSYIHFDNPAAQWLISRAEDVTTALLKRYDIRYCGVSRGASAWLGHFGIKSSGEVNNAIDADAFAAESSGRDFLAQEGLPACTTGVVFDSRLIEGKGLEAFVQAARLLEGEENLHFFVAGDGPLAPWLAEQAGTMDNLSYLGRLTHADLAALLRQSKIFCFPTQYGEGLPTNLLEAGACGCALITTQTGGTDEIVPTPAHGIVLERGDAEEIAQVIRSLIVNPARLQRLRRAAAGHVRERFSWRNSAAQLLAVMR